MKSKKVDQGFNRREFLGQAGAVLVGASLGSEKARGEATIGDGAVSNGAIIGVVEEAGGKIPFNRFKMEGKYYQATVPDTLDLAERAHLGVKHLMNITSEKDDYEMYWGVQRLGLPKEVLEYIGHTGENPLGGDFDEYTPPIMNFWWSMLQACQPKCMEALAMERIMTGSQFDLDREAKMLEAIASHVGGEGVYWVPPTANKPWLGPDEVRPYANVHGQGRVMRAAIAWYQYSGHPGWKDLIDRMVDGMDRVLVVHKQDYAYFPVHGWIEYEYFRSCYIKGRGWKDTIEPENEKEGEEGSLFNHQGHIPGALATWYQLTGNKQALRLSGELVRFLTKPKFWSNWKGGEYPGVVGTEHAHWDGHWHGHINTLRATLEYALAANDDRLKAFARDGYDWARQAGFARIGLFGDGQGCACGRIIGLAVKLTYAGLGDYWEDVDQYVRNHGTEMQLTPEDIPYLQKIGQGKPAPAPDPSATTDNVMERTIGAFSNHVPPLKVATSGCCTPHGHMGLFYAWDGILRYSDGVAQVNLLLNRASPWMDVDSHLPYEGKVVLRNKAAREAFVRIPLWADQKAVKCRIGERSVQRVWLGRYLRFQGLKPGDLVTIEFPIEEQIEHWTAPPQGAFPGYTLLTVMPEGTRYTCKFKGNTLIELTPPLAPGSWLYQHRPQQFRASKAPPREVTRFVTPFVLTW
jgi:hypothetical protein